MKSRKLLHLIPYMLVGGAQTFVIDLIKAMPEDRHVVVCTTPSEVEVPIPDEARHYAKITFVRGVSPGTLDFFAPDVVNYHWWPELSPIVSPVKTGRKAPAIVFVHDSRTRVPDVPSVHYVCMGRESARFHGHLKDAAIIHACIDTTVFDLPPKPRADSFVIGRVTSSSPIKFPPRLIELLSSFDIPGVRFMLMDGSPYIGQPGVPDNFALLAKSAMPVPEFLRSLDVFVYKTAESCVETWPRVIAEAMAAGLPVVAEKKGGIVEQVEHGKTGFLCETDDEFRHYCELLYREPELRAKMGSAARAVARERFGLATLRDAYLSLLSRVGRG